MPNFKKVPSGPEFRQLLNNFLKGIDEIEKDMDSREIGDRWYLGMESIKYNATNTKIN